MKHCALMQGIKRLKYLGIASHYITSLKEQCIQEIKIINETEMFYNE